MKFLLPLALLTVFLLPGCTDNSTKSKQQDVVYTSEFFSSFDQTADGYQPLYLHPIPSADQIDTDRTDYGSYGQLLPPPLEKFEVQVLTKSTWAFEYYVDSDASITQRLAGAGQWLEFRPDGTFTGGHYDKQTHSGAWYMDYQLKYPRITIDSNVDQLDAIWEIQGVNGEQSAMSWRRVPDSGFGPPRMSVMGKLIELYDRPTKAQFAKQWNKSQGQ